MHECAIAALGIPKSYANIFTVIAAFTHTRRRKRAYGTPPFIADGFPSRIDVKRDSRIRLIKPSLTTARARALDARPCGRINTNRSKRGGGGEGGGGLDGVGGRAHRAISHVAGQI
jgi:hypothetical protein